MWSPVGRSRTKNGRKEKKRTRKEKTRLGTANVSASRSFSSLCRTAARYHVAIDTGLYRTFSDVSTVANEYRGCQLLQHRSFPSQCSYTFFRNVCPRGIYVLSCFDYVRSPQASPFAAPFLPAQGPSAGLCRPFLYGQND
jgi:hypothetical protein